MSDVANRVCSLSAEKQYLSLKKQLEDICNSRAEPFNLLLAARLGGSKSFRIVRSEVGFLVYAGICEKDREQGRLLCSELGNAIELLNKTASCFSPALASFSEKLFLISRRISWSVVRSDMTLGGKQRTLRILTAVQCLLAKNIHGSLQYHQEKKKILSHILSEPQRNIEKIMCLHQYFLYVNYARRLTHFRSSDDKYPGAGRFLWAERDTYRNMSNSSNESRVLVTIHMGDFFGAFKCIAAELDNPRPVISLRRDGDTEAIRNLIKSHADIHQVFEHGSGNPLKIVNSLRRGGQTMAVLFDLGDEFGKTTEVRFFGCRARFVRGPAEMAIAGRARIYPFFCFSEAGRDIIDMVEPFLPQVYAGDTLHEAAARVTQKLVTLAEGWIRKYPEQWKYLESLPSYLINEKHDIALQKGKYA